MIKFAVLISTILILCSCAGTPQNAEQVDTGNYDKQAMLAASADSSEKEYCTTVKKTGSHIPMFYCRTYTEDERAREQSRAWLDKVKAIPQHSIDTSG